MSELRNRPVLPIVTTAPHSIGLCLYAEQVGTVLARLYVRPSVRPSECPSRFAAVGPAGRRYRSIAAAAVGECEQCRVVSVRMLLNTSLV